MLLLGVLIVKPVQSYVFVLTSINCLNIKCKFCRKEKKRSHNANFEIHGNTVSPNFAKSAEKCKPASSKSLWYSLCNVFLWYSRLFVFFHFLSNITHLPMPERLEPFSIKKLERKWKKTKLPLLKKLWKTCS